METSYKEKYEQAIERLKQWDREHPCAGYVLSDRDKFIFPELAESEDEKVRKKIIDYFRGSVGLGVAIGGVSVKDMVSWLEKQGDYANFRDKAQVGDRITKNEAGVLVNLSQLKRVAKPSEKKGEQKASYTTIVETGDGGINALVTRELPTDSEQKPADKVESHFHVEKGKWYMCIKNNVGITKGNAYYGISDGYIIDDNGRKYNCNNWAVFQRYLRLWDITIDAKDGDVLYSLDSKQPFIFKHRKTNEQAEAYCGINIYGKFFVGNTKDCIITTDKYIPATKEQRDTLMKAMTDAGYTFDFEMKELKKIEQKSADKIEPIFNVGDKIQYLKGCGTIMTIEKIENGEYIFANNMGHTTIENGNKCYLVEQKPIDKVEPKFKVGDWIINPRTGLIKHIKNVLLCDNNGNYEFESSSMSIDSVDNSFRLWTIQDAKDGDILYHSDTASNGIFIFKELLEYEFEKKVICYCDYDSEDGFCLGESHTCCWANAKILHPATKEQRDLLFQEMKEAGYEWDVDTKELKKVEDEEYNDEDYGIDGLYHAQRILEKTIGKVDGYQSDDGILEHKCAITAVKKLYEHKPTNWSEEDERMFNSCCAAVCAADYYTLDDKQDIENWLKSLKDRVQQQPKQEWSDVDKDILFRTINDLKFLRDTISIDPKYAVNIIDMEREITWLKSIKDRVQPQNKWKPSETDIMILEKVFNGKIDPKDFQVTLFNVLEQLKKL